MQEITIPAEYYCPITQLLMVDPVNTEDGHTFEREAITRWFEKNNTSPSTNLPLQTKQLIPNHALRKLIQDFIAKNINQIDPENIYLSESKKKAFLEALQKSEKEKIRDLIKSDKRLIHTPLKSLFSFKIQIAYEIMADKADYIWFYDEYLGDLDLTKIDRKSILPNFKLASYVEHAAKNNSLTVDRLNKLYALGLGFPADCMNFWVHLVMHNRIDVIESLLERAEDYKKAINFSYCYDNLTEALQLKLDFNFADPYLKVTPLAIAYFLDKDEIVRRFAEKGLINAPAIYKAPPQDVLTLFQYLMVASDSVNPVKNLVQLGADLLQKDSEGFSVWHYLMLNPNPAASEIFQYLSSVVKNSCEAVNSINKRGDTPLHLVAYKGDIAKIKFLLAQGANINSKNLLGHTPLHYASYTGNAEAVKLLLGSGARPDGVDYEENSPLHLASQHLPGPLLPAYLNSTCKVPKFSDRYQFIIEGDIDKVRVEKKKNPQYFLSKDSNGFNGIEIAFICNKKEIFSLLFDLSPIIEEFYLLGRYVEDYDEIFDILDRIFNLALDYPVNVELYYAFLEIADRAIMYIEKQGGYVEDMRTEYAMFINQTIAKQNQTIFIILLERWREKNCLLSFDEESQELPLETAVKAQGSFYLENIIKELKKTAPDKSLFTIMKDANLELNAIITVLVKACEAGNMEAVKLLLKEGFSEIINEADDDGLTPLGAATWNGDLMLIEFLMAAGAKVIPEIAEEYESEQPLLIAIEKDNIELVEYFFRKMDSEVDHTIVVSAFIEVLRKHNIQMLALLSNFYPDILEDIDEETHPPLIIEAILECQYEENRAFMVQVIKQYSRIIELCENNEVNLLAIPTKQGDIDTIKFLLAHGVNPDIRTCWFFEGKYLIEGSPIHITIGCHNEELALFLWPFVNLEKFKEELTNDELIKNGEVENIFCKGNAREIIRALILIWNNENIQKLNGSSGEKGDENILKDKSSGEMEQEEDSNENEGPTDHIVGDRYTKVIRLLMQYGADAKAENLSGETPLSLAYRDDQVLAERIEHERKKQKTSMHAHMSFFGETQQVIKGIDSLGISKKHSR